MTLTSKHWNKPNKMIWLQLIRTTTINTQTNEDENKQIR